MAVLTDSLVRRITLLFIEIATAMATILCLEVPDSNFQMSLCTLPSVE